ncbi:hypothetical protein ONZ43_g1817 [Nemania bipapillata]|uniref:Uncharacterized protein n=1 Tax=Nemania bipapillata TaxID=110536 RepID=A0ACC2J317_9PEZI|nr:hypothetical protein ONZ43_g1817 [Nemania bipapillata]
MFSEYASRFLSQSQSRLSNFGAPPDNSDPSSRQPTDAPSRFSRQPARFSYQSRLGNPYQSSQSRFGGFASRYHTAPDAPLFHSALNEFRDDDDEDDVREAADFRALQHSRRVFVSSRMEDSSASENDASRASLDQSGERDNRLYDERDRPMGIKSSWNGESSFKGRQAKQKGREEQPTAGAQKTTRQNSESDDGKMVDVGLESTVMDNSVPEDLLLETPTDSSPPAFQQFKSPKGGSRGMASRAHPNLERDHRLMRQAIAEEDEEEDEDENEVTEQPRDIPAPPQPRIFQGPDHGSRLQDVVMRAVDMLDFSSRILAANPALVLLGFGTLAFVVGWTWVWLWMFTRIFLGGYFSTKLSAFVIGTATWWLAVFFFLMYVWTLSVVSGVVRATTGGTVSNWYFHRNLQTLASSNDIVKGALGHSTTTVFAVTYASIHSMPLMESAAQLSRIQFLATGPTTTLTPSAFSRRNQTASLIPYRMAKLLLHAARFVMSTGLGFAAWVMTARQLRIQVPDSPGMKGSAYAYVVGIVASMIGWGVLGAMEGILSGILDGVLICYASERRLERATYCIEAAKLFEDRSVVSTGGNFATRLTLSFLEVVMTLPPLRITGTTSTEDTTKDTNEAVRTVTNHCVDEDGEWLLVDHEKAASQQTTQHASAQDEEKLDAEPKEAEITADNQPDDKKKREEDTGILEPLYVVPSKLDRILQRHHDLRCAGDNGHSRSKHTGCSMSLSYQGAPAVENPWRPLEGYPAYIALESARVAEAGRKLPARMQYARAKTRVPQKARPSVALTHGLSNVEDLRP